MLSVRVMWVSVYKDYLEDARQAHQEPGKAHQKHQNLLLSQKWRKLWTNTVHCCSGYQLQVCKLQITVNNAEQKQLTTDIFAMYTAVTGVQHSCTATTQIIH